MTCSAARRRGPGRPAAPPIGADHHLALWPIVTPSFDPSGAECAPVSTARPSATRAAMVVVAVVAVLIGGCGSAAVDARSGPAVHLTGSATKPTTANERLDATAATASFRSYLGRASASFVADVGRLQDDLEAGNVATARLDELAAQAGFDQFRQVAGGDPVNASTLDELASQVGAGQSFGGLHAVERDLWATTGPPTAPSDGSVSQALGDATGLVAQAPVAEFLLSKSTLRPEAIGVTAVDDLGWVDSVAIPGDEELYSRLDAVDVAAGIGAAHDAFVVIAPLATLVAPALSATVSRQFATLLGLAAALGPPTELTDSSMTAATRLSLSQQTDATAGDLAQLSATLVPFGTSGGSSYGASS